MIDRASSTTMILALPFLVLMNCSPEGREVSSQESTRQELLHQINVFLTGDIIDAGSWISLPAKASIADAITAGGGFAGRSDLSGPYKCRISRKVLESEEATAYEVQIRGNHGEKGLAFELEDGDSLHFPIAIF